MQAFFIVWCANSLAVKNKDGESIDGEYKLQKIKII